MVGLTRNALIAGPPRVIIEFTVAGPPVSPQTANRANLHAWMRRVRSAAKARWDRRRRPAEGPLQVIATYFHDRPSSRLDVDNAIKPILDSMAGLVFTNDAQITDARLRKTNIDGKFHVRRMSEVLARAFVNGDEFVYIRVEEIPDHAEFL